MGASSRDVSLQRFHHAHHCEVEILVELKLVVHPPGVALGSQGFGIRQVKSAQSVARDRVFRQAPPVPQFVFFRWLDWAIS